MQVTVNRKANNEVELLITVLSEELKPFLVAAAENISTATSIAGFRVGKAPYDMVKAKVGEMKIYEAALEPVVNKTFIEAIKQETLEPVGMPKISITKIAPGSPLEYKAEIALLPEVKLVDYAAVTVKPQTVTVTEEEIKKVVEEIRDMRTSSTGVERAAQSGDRVKLDIELFMDSIPLEGGQGKAAIVDLGKEMYIPGFDAEIMGLATGAKKEFTLTFPKDYADKKMADKPIEFRVSVQEVLELKRPEINDDFAQAVGRFKTVDEFYAKVKENVLLDKQAGARDQEEGEMLGALVEKSSFGAIPNLLQEAEIDKMINELRGSVEQRGAKFEEYLTHIKKTPEDLRHDFVKPAEQRIKTSLVVRTVAKQEAITVAHEEVEAELEQLRLYYRDSKETLEQLAAPHYKDWARANLLNRKVIAFLRSKIIKATEA